MEFNGELIYKRRWHAQQPVHAEDWISEDGVLVGPVEDGRRYIERDDMDLVFPTDEKAAQVYALRHGYSYEREYLSDKPGDFRVYVIVDGNDEI